MKYIMAIWIVLIVGASLWGISTRASSLFGPTDTEAVSESGDDSASQTVKETNAILGNSATRAFRPRNTVEAKVIEVVDGDSIRVELDGKQIDVGYLGIDAPEIDHPVQGTEAFGEEALERNRQLVEGKTVRLERDIIETDRGGQQLYYVYVEDLMVNALLLHEGLAQTHDYARGLKYAEVIYELQSQAIVERRGGWRSEWPNTLRVR